MTRDPRIDDYIARAQPFARPILERVRERVHAVVPDVEEDIKWGTPTYLIGGKIMLGTAAFKAHAIVNFWRGKELGFATNEGAMGQLGKLTSVDQLPSDLDAMIARAAELAGSATPPKPKREPKPAPAMHPTSPPRSPPLPEPGPRSTASRPRRSATIWSGFRRPSRTPPAPGASPPRSSG